MITELAIIGRLLDYPKVELHENHEELATLMRQSTLLPQEKREHIASQISDSLSQDIYEQQMRYDGLFERGPSLSLLLFEHVHGESRDRGQAMVDLLEIYFNEGMHPRVDELPDYLPLFLEFLSTQSVKVASQWLSDVSHILLLLAERLRKRGAWEAELFDALLIISDSPEVDEGITEKVLAEEDDFTLEAIDKAWEDKEIRFDTPSNGEEGCSVARGAVNYEQPLVHMPNRRLQKEI